MKQTNYEQPNAVNLERAVLGAMIVDVKAVEEAVVLLKNPEVFFDPQHRTIYEAMLQMVHTNEPIDMKTLSNRLRKLGTIEAAGGDLMIVELAMSVSGSAHLEHYCRIILQEWVRRMIIKLSLVQVNDAKTETKDVFDLLEQSEKDLDHINEMLTGGTDIATFSQALKEVVTRVELLSKLDNSKVSGVTTGFKKLNDFTGGWQNSDLIIIAARPGMGKTALILKNLLEVALNDEPVGMFSLEMSAQQLATRLMAINSEFHLGQLMKHGFEKQEYFLKLLKIQGEMTDLPIYIDDTPGITIYDLYMKARMWKRKYDIKILFVDYIQLMSGESKNGNREQEIAVISRKLKHLAKELNIPVVALSQLSRQVEARTDKRPRLSDLRESGAIEQDADVVIFIYRPEYYNDIPTPELTSTGGNTEIIFAKYRSGSLETKALYWQGDKTKFMDPEDHYVHSKTGVVF